MKPLAVLIFAFIAVAVTARFLPARSEIGPRIPVESIPTFRAVSVYIDAGSDALAAYQFEFEAAGDVKLVGIEGGDHAAFKNAPHYDPLALTQPKAKAIIADFNTGRNLPSGKTRIATLMLRVGGPHPDYQFKLTAAATSDGKPINAKLTFEEGSQP